jgi:hypothetical protein
LVDEPDEVLAFQVAMEEIFIKASLLRPYDPSPASAHKLKLDQAEE